MAVSDARLTAQLLAGRPAAGPVEVVERLLAVQAQDARAARLAVRSRTRGLGASDIDAALDRRELVITWLNRGTLHLVRAEDYPWLHALTAPTLVTGCVRRLDQTGVSPAQADRGVAVIDRALAHGPHTRLQLRDLLDEAGVPTGGQALVHVLMLATLRGVAVRGPMAGKQQAYVLVRDWLGEPPPVDRERALAELARRYLAGHGPADDRDLAKWAGLPLRDARAALASAGPQPVPRDPPPLPPPRLLGAFDPLLLGWASRAYIVGTHGPKIVSGGLFRPFALVEGKAVATWRVAGGAVELEPFQDLVADSHKVLAEDAADVVRFLGLRCAPATT